MPPAEPLYAQATGEFPRLTLAGASHLASLPLKSLSREYPNKIAHVLESDAHLAPPRQLHPAFYGCFDWHSSVHGHWILVRLLKQFPELPAADQARSQLANNLQPQKIQAEIDYMTPASRRSFERPYGWAWLLKLSQELREWDDPQGKNWAAALQPLADFIESLYIEFLPRQTYPIRSGAHLNTAFGLSFAMDYADAWQRDKLKSAIADAAIRYYAADESYPAHYEPSGSDFLSPCLEEAALMQRVLDEPDFVAWFDKFLPQIPDTLAQPATVSDREDGQLVHLDGLNLSRAWCYSALSKKLPPNHPQQAKLAQLASAHIAASLPHVVSGSYEGEHWLASFAVYALTS